ncbi:hypothetical protein Q5H93_12165 [Hymenobacter sp. ASUV-10]|uniref:Lipocalin-like domain-containing protein n=1 Tax=Hymenobacter aranciens TaxID=3063996 RepID=A0ABT9BB38_9BACT|nr:hypothetical protein [Hymenobacter sp. ASUV-10]MDO7875489.1 hypothetical protein [Hymenobacter sp. ASUV-10]
MNIITPAKLEGRWFCQTDSLASYQTDGTLAGFSTIGYLHYTRISPGIWTDSLRAGNEVYAYTRQGDTLIVSPGFVNYHNVPFTQSSGPEKHVIVELTAHRLHLRTSADVQSPGGSRYHEVFNRYYSR